MHPAWSNTKNGTNGILAKITMGHGTEGPEYGMSGKNSSGRTIIAIVNVPWQKGIKSGYVQSLGHSVFLQTPEFPYNTV